MTKNTKTYLLLGVVLLIWGIIGFRVLSAFNPDQPEEVAQADLSTFKPELAIQKDTFSIVADYRDPFLGTMPKRKTVKIKATPKKVVPKIAVSYTGSIFDSDSNSRIFFVTIAGTQYLMNHKDTKGGVTLLSGNDRHIKVKYHNRIETISLQPQS